MSAFVVSDKHINTIVTWAARQNVNYRSGDEWMPIRGHEQQVAQMLLNQNVRSVNYRYNEHDDVSAIRYTPVHLTSGSGYRNALQVMKAAQCYNYQACETDDYESTGAHAIYHAILYRAISVLTSDESLEWEIK